jgi:N-acetylneuraminic acid mutarotase
VNGKIYLIGGYRGSNLIFEYDPSADTWTELARTPTKRIGMVSSVVDGKIYIVGGYISGIPTYPGVSLVEVFDPAAGIWGTAPDMPTKRYGATATLVDGKIYVIGGMKDWRYADTDPAYGMVEVFEP